MRCEILVQSISSHCPGPEVITRFVGWTFRQLFLIQLFCWNCLAEPKEEEEEGSPALLRAPGHPCLCCSHDLCPETPALEGRGCSDPHLLWVEDVPGIGALPAVFLSNIPGVQWVQDVVGVINTHFPLNW